MHTYTNYHTSEENNQHGKLHRQEMESLLPNNKELKSLENTAENNINAKLTRVNAADTMIANVKRDKCC